MTMRHLLLVVLVGCGGGGIDGEPMTGTVSLDYGGSKPKMAVGAAVESMDAPTKMLVQIGSDNVDCGTYLDVFLDFDAPSGTFIFFTVDKTSTGMLGTSISVEKSGGRDVSVTEAPGAVLIDSTAERVTGTVTLSTTNEDVGAITVAGSFDVKRCF
jgi:hypothetical protein